MSSGSKKVIVFALLANLGIATAKFVGAFFSGSTALKAEAVHSVVDSANELLLLLGKRLSRQKPTELHPLGFGREAFFWSFIVALLLFSLGGLFAIYEGIHKFRAHEGLTSPWLGLAILVMSAGFEGASFSACYREVKKRNRFGSLWRWYHKSTASELLVVFTEDSAALVGLTIAATGLLLSWHTHDPRWDAAASIAVGTLLVCVAILLAIEIKSLLIGEAPSVDLHPQIESIVAEEIPHGKLLHLIAMQVGNDQIVVSCKIHPGTIESAPQLIEALHQVEKKIKARLPAIRWTFLEPVYR